MAIEPCPQHGTGRFRIAAPVVSILGQAIGVLKIEGNLVTDDPYPGSQWNLRTLEGFAQAIGPPLGRWWKLTDGALLRRVIDEGATAGASQRQLDQLLEKTLESLGKYLQASMGSIYVLEEGSGEPELVMRAGIGPDAALVGKARYKIGEGITGSIAQRRDPLTFRTRDERHGYEGRRGKYSSELKYPDLSGKSPAFLGVPILLGDKVLGVWKIEYIAATEEHPDPYFTPEDERTAQILSSFLAYAIETGRYRSLTHNLGSFVTSSITIEKATGEDEAVLALIDGLNNSSFRSAMVSLLGADDVIRGKWYSGTKFEKILEQTARNADGPDILADVLRSGSPVLISDSRLDPRCDQAAVKEAGLVAQYILPLKLGDERIGALQGDLGDDPSLDPDQQLLLQSFVGHLALTLSRLRTAHRLDDMNQQMMSSARFIVAEELSGWVVHSFTRKLDDVLKQLRSDLKKQEVRENRVLNEALSKWKTNLETAANDLKAALASVRAGGVHEPGQAEIHDEIQSAITTWHHFVSSRGTRIVFTPSASKAEVRLQPHAFRELISVLLINSVEAFAKEIQITTADVDGAEAPAENYIDRGVSISVVDDGHGLPDFSNLEQLFESSYTTKKKVGSGLGLFIARRLARRGGGDLFVSKNQPKKGASFTIILPVIAKKESA